MAKTNFQIFNEENAPERTYNDSEYKEATQRVGGVMPGMALSRMHNKMYYQWSAMCKAIANLIVNHGHDCMDSDVEGITRYLDETITSAGYTALVNGVGLVQRSTRYELGDILYDTQLTRHDLRLECVQAGTTAATLQDLSGVHLGQGITDGTVVWRVKRLYTIDGDMFEIDTDGGIMPTAEPHYSVNYELDEDGNIMPKAM